MTKITVDKALIEQALEAFERIDAWFKVRHFVGLVPQEVEIATSLRAALAEPVVEPVAVHQVKLDARRWRDIAKDEMQNYIAKGFWETRTLYTSPPPPAEPESGVCQTCISLSRAVMLDQTGSA